MNYSTWHTKKLPRHWRPGGKHFKNNPERVNAFNRDREAHERTMPTTRSLARGDHPRSSKGRSANIEPGASNRFDDIDFEEDILDDNRPPPAKKSAPPAGQPMDEDPPPNRASGPGIVGGSTTQAVPQRTLQLLRNNEELTWLYVPCESTYRTRSLIKTAFNHKQIYTIPWESFRECHCDAQWMSQASTAIGWKPVDASVEIYNMRAHADIPIATSSFYPINLDQVRLRFIPHSRPLSARVAPFNTEAQHSDWKTLLQNQEDGIADKPLPVAEVHVGSIAAMRAVRYTDYFWSEKKVVDDEMVSFHWSGDGPLRHLNELFIQTHQKTKIAAPHTWAANHSSTWLIDHRFDYRAGVIDPPFIPMYRFYDKKESDPGYSGYNLACRANVWGHMTHDTVANMPRTRNMVDDSESVLDISTAAKYKSMYGALVVKAGYSNYSSTDIDDDVEAEAENFYQLPQAEPYYDDNLMKPIFLDFSRFMKDDSIQEYRVYFAIRIKHTVKFLVQKRSIDRLNLYNVYKGQPNLYISGGVHTNQDADTPVMNQHLSNEIMIGDVGDGFGHDKQSNPFITRYYRPLNVPIKLKTVTP